VIDEDLAQVTEAIQIMLLDGYKDARRAADMFWAARRSGRNPVDLARHLVKLRQAIR